MKFMKEFRPGNLAIVLLPFLLSVAACTSITTRNNETLMSRAGFQKFAANSDAKMQQLMSLPPDKVTIARIKGAPYYVFPDPVNKLLYVGNAEQYETFQQLQSYYKLEGDSRVLAQEDEGPGDDTAKWVEWTSDTGWTHGTYNY